MSLITRGSIYAILSGFLYGFVGYFGLTVLHQDVSVYNMTFWRFFIASVAMLVMVLPKIRTYRQSLLELFLAFTGGALFYGLSTLLYFIACRYISSGLAMVLLFTFPVMVIAMNIIFLGHSLVLAYSISALIILAGMGLMVDKHELTMDLTGIAIMIVSAFCYACYIMTSKQSKMPPELSTLLITSGCMLTALIFAMADRSLSLPAHISIWLPLLGIGILSTVLPVLLLMYSLRYISSERASILSVLEPVFVVINGVLLLGEQLTIMHALGVIMVLSGALLTLFSKPTAVLSTADCEG